MYKHLKCNVHEEKGKCKGKREQIHFVKAVMTGRSLEISNSPMLTALHKLLPENT